MSWTVTLSIFAAVLALVLFCGWRGSRASDPSRGPRMFPYHLVMICGCAVLLMLLVHMLNLGGATTGRPGY